ncbi:FtsX-like permease family protein [Streptomyces silvensis]|uniref:ABC transporter permease n=1 Tax=Streptomyces silvensis TaxID=1765722 RepID=A0A0W7WYB2_9ACTN|nr:FtsX-like permease family protein [Streptomyces silvensis]KUF15521.1 ABC transporter permease [Streptomyces silvensis]
MVLSSLRARWAGFLGAFVAVALGVTLVAAMGVGLAASLDPPVRAPVRFADSPVVVAGQDTLTVPVRRGPGTGRATEKLAHPHPVDNELLRELRRLGRVTTGSTGSTGSTSSTSSTSSTGSTGNTGGMPAGSAGVDAVGVDAPVRAVRAAVAASGTGARVLTGADRRLVDPATERDARALVAVNAFLGTAGAVAAFVAAFVTASTFAFVVALRRREFGLLRAAGASRGQVRRWLLGEALAVGAVASAAGCAGGAWAAPVLARTLVDAGVAPPWFTVAEGFSGSLWFWWPYQVAFWSGLVVAVGGAWAAARRAGRVSPVEALREASLDVGVMPLARRVVGAGLLLGGGAWLLWTLWAAPAELMKRKFYVVEGMVLAGAAAALVPLVVRYVDRVALACGGTAPRGARSASRGGWRALVRVARANMTGAVRRTGAVAAPVLVTVALAGCLLGSAATVGRAKAEEARARTAADLVVTGDRLRPVPAGGVPGAVVTASAATAVYVREDGGTALVRSEARAVADPRAFAALTRLPVVAGDVRRLDDRSLVVNEEWERHRVGERVDVRLGDGRRARLRIVAVLARGTGDNGAYVTSRNAPAAPVDRLDVRLRAGADRAAVAAALREATGGEVRSAREWVAAEYPGMRRQTRLGLLMLLGICLAYTAISLAGTQLMTAPVRGAELRALRLVGATPGQIRVVVGVEAGFAVGVGVVLGLGVVGVGLGGLSAGLARLSAPAGVVVPWGVMGVCVGVCGVVGVGAAVLGVGLAGRPRPTPSP